MSLRRFQPLTVLAVIGALALALPGHYLGAEHLHGHGAAETHACPHTTGAPAEEQPSHPETTPSDDCSICLIARSLAMSIAAEPGLLAFVGVFSRDWQPQQRPQSADPHSPINGRGPPHSV